LGKGDKGVKLIRLVSIFVLMGLACIADVRAEQEPCVKSCREHPMLSGPCFRIKGRMSLYNGTPTFRIWPIGTKRILGVSEGRFRLDGYENLPKDLKNQMSWDNEMFGDLLVCPFTNDRPGVMRLICVESAENVSIKTRR
jgi:hypothetical protein